VDNPQVGKQPYTKLGRKCLYIYTHLQSSSRPLL